MDTFSHKLDTIPELEDVRDDDGSNGAFRAMMREARAANVRQWLRLCRAAVDDTGTSRAREMPGFCALWATKKTIAMLAHPVIDKVVPSYVDIANADEKTLNEYLGKSRAAIDSLRADTHHFAIEPYSSSSPALFLIDIDLTDDEAVNELSVPIMSAPKSKRTKVTHEAESPPPFEPRRLFEPSPVSPASPIVLVQATIDDSSVSPMSELPPVPVLRSAAVLQSVVRSVGETEPSTPFVPTAPPPRDYLAFNYDPKMSNTQNLLLRLNGFKYHALNNAFTSKLANTRHDMLPFCSASHRAAWIIFSLVGRYPGPDVGDDVFLISFCSTIYTEAQNEQVSSCVHLGLFLVAHESSTKETGVFSFVPGAAAASLDVGVASQIEPIILSLMGMYRQEMIHEAVREPVPALVPDMCVCKPPFDFFIPFNPVGWPGKYVEMPPPAL